MILSIFTVSTGLSENFLVERLFFITANKSVSTTSADSERNTKSSNWFGKPGSKSSGVVCGTYSSGEAKSSSGWKSLINRMYNLMILKNSQMIEIILG